MKLDSTRRSLLVGLCLSAALFLLVRDSSPHPVTLSQHLIAQDRHDRHRSSPHVKRVPYPQLVSDIKRVLEDVETNMEARRSTEHGQPSRQHARSSADPRTHKRRDLDEVNHIMDGLQALADGGSGHNSIAPERRRRRRREHRGRVERKDDESAGAEARLAHKHKHLTLKDKKKEAILAKMKALQQQIEGDFKKVTGYGKQAGYVPPPKIPHV
eukprot:748228-Hanusia_phi.AAC.1